MENENVRKHRRRRSPVKPVTITTSMCPPDLVVSILTDVPIFRALSRREVEAVSRSFHQVGFAEGETIYQSGAPARHLYVVAEGAVKLLEPTPEGRELLVELASRGSFFGRLSILPNDRYGESAVAQTAVCLLSIESRDFQVLLREHPSAALEVLRITNERLRAARDLIQRISTHSVERRIAHALLELAGRLGERGREGLLIQLPLSRDDLAGLVGTTAETTSRIVSRLEGSGVLRTGRKWISILDSGKLAHLAED